MYTVHVKKYVMDSKSWYSFDVQASSLGDALANAREWFSEKDGFTEHGSESWYDQESNIHLIIEIEKKV